MTKSWEVKFEEVKPRLPWLISNKREVWVQLYGIPLHIWDGNVFKIRANGVGEFIDSDEDTTSKYRLEMVRLKLSNYIV